MTRPPCVSTHKNTESERHAGCTHFKDSEINKSSYRTNRNTMYGMGIEMYVVLFL